MLTSLYESVWQWANRGALALDTEHERLRKALLTVVSTAVACLAFIWGIVYLFADYPHSAAIPIIYAAISIITISYYRRTKRFAFFRLSQFVLILVLPYLLQLSLGGFANGSAVMIWAFFAPLAALFFDNIRSAFRWLLAFIALAIVCGVVEATWLTNAVPMFKPLNTFFFVLNVGFGFGLMFVVLYFFVLEQERSNAEAKHTQEEAVTAKTELELAYSRLQENEAKIRELMLTDPLTGLPNRRFLDQRLQEEVKRVRRYGNSVCIIMTDLDNFKLVNDKYGHAVGDATLQMFSHILQDSIRSVDFVARYGGEEFVVLLPETLVDGAVQLAERIREQTAARNIPTADKKLSASFGVTRVRGDESIYDALGRADQALYKSKEKGRNTVTFMT